MKDLIILAIAVAMITYCLTKAEDRKHRATELQRELDSIKSLDSLRRNPLHKDSVGLSFDVE